MLDNYFKTTIRSFRRNKLFTSLNVFGLVVGLVTCMLISLYVMDEYSYDQFNKNAQRIFRLNTDVKSGEASTSNAIAPPVMSSTILRNFPEVENAVRILPSGEYFKKDNEWVGEGKVAYCDPAIFNVFTLPMIEGTWKTALSNLNSIVITESTARKYFNNTHVVGRSMSRLTGSDAGNQIIHIITGVIKDIPRQSHFDFDILMPMASVAQSFDDHFNDMFPFTTYILMKPGADYKKLEVKFPGLLKMNLDFIGEMEAHGDYYRMNLTPLLDIHLNSNRDHELGTNGNKQFVNMFSAIALLILLIACLNYINLSTAHSADRAREVGVRKVLGSTRGQLVIQFIFESVLVTAIAAILAFLLGWLLLPFFNQLADKNIQINSKITFWMVSFFLCFIFTVGVLTGTYPAFFLSSFRPVNVLKGIMVSGMKGNRFRNVLVVVQFSISTLLIIATLVLYNQLDYMQNKDIGLDRHQMLIVKNINSLDQMAGLFKQKVKQLPGVENLTLSSFLPFGERRWRNFVSTHTTGLQTEFWPVDADYLNTMGMHIVEGRNFDKNKFSDSTGIILNQTAVKMLHYENNALGKKIFYGKDREFHVIGVVKDFNYSSMKEAIAPVVMMMMTPIMRQIEGDGPDALCVKINSSHLTALLSRIENEWKALNPQKQFEYSFMDQDFDALYRSEQRLGKLFVIFTTLALIIACLGLFGLSTYTAERRNKEISIRKILGADVSTIVAMLSQDFIKLVLISIFIAIPTGWFAMHKWLENFAYRVDIYWWIFVISGFVAVIISLLTICFQSFKAALANPIKALKTE